MLARYANPVFELRAILVDACTEQVTGNGRRIVGKLPGRRTEVVLDTIGKTQTLVRLDQLSARRAPQPEQALPQTVARLVRIGIGP